MNALFRCSLVILALFLVSTQIWHIFNFPLWTDDAFFGTVARNLASGDGYFSSSTELNSLFSPFISSGPAIILPAALLIKIFGNQYWVIGLTSIIIIWSLLIAIFVNFKSEEKYLCSFLALFLCLLFSLNRGNYGIYNSDQFSLWYLMLGEIPASLFIILGSLLLSRKKILLGSLILGLAVMCKTISGIACAVILLVNAAIIFRDDRENYKKNFKLIFLSGLTFIAPFLLFELVKIISLGWDYYREIQLQNTVFYKAISLATDTRPAEKIYHLFYIFGYSSILTLALIGYLITSSKTNRNHPYYQLGVTLIACFILHSLWWIFCSIFINYRYFSPALFYCIFGIFFLASCSDIRAKKFITLISLIILFRHESLDHMISNSFVKNDKLDEQLLVAQHITELQKKNISIISCGLNFELEYILPQKENFINCKNLPKTLPDHQFMLVNDFIYPNKILMKNGNGFTKITHPPVHILSRCSEEYIATNTFSLSWCK